MYRRIPVTDQFIIEPQQGNRTARHFKGSDIASYEGTSNGNILAMQNSGEFVGNDIEFDQRGPTHAIDKGQHTFTSFQAKVIDDGDGKHFCHFSGGRELNTTAARFAMNANANLHLVITDFKGRLASRRNGAGSKSHTHTATLAVHLLRQGSHLFQGGARLSQATHDFLEQYGNTNAAPASSIEAILHRYVVIGDHACDLNPFSLGQLSCHLEVQHVTGVVLDDVEHAGTAIDGACRGKHLIWHRRGKDGSRASCIE